MKNILPQDSGIDLFMIIVMIGAAYIFVSEVIKRDDDDTT